MSPVNGVIVFARLFNGPNNDLFSIALHMVVILAHYCYKAHKKTILADNFSIKNPLDCSQMLDFYHLYTHEQEQRLPQHPISPILLMPRSRSNAINVGIH
jgi:hypothetical protein